MKRPAAVAQSANETTAPHDLETLTRAVRRAGRIRTAGSLFFVFAALCTAFLWTPLDTRALAETTGYSRDTVTRAVRTLVRAGALQQRPAPHGHLREVRLAPQPISRKGGGA